MSLKQQRAEEQQRVATGKTLEAEAVKPIIATTRPSLTDAKKAIVRRLPQSYAGRTVRDVLGYVVESEAKDSEADTLRSLKNELGAAGSLVVINGKNAKLTDSVEKYLVDRTKDIDGRSIAYQELEIEVSAVQQGGYRYFR